MKKFPFYSIFVLVLLAGLIPSNPVHAAGFNFQPQDVTGTSDFYSTTASPVVSENTGSTAPSKSDCNAVAQAAGLSLAKSYWCVGDYGVTVAPCMLVPGIPGSCNPSGTSPTVTYSILASPPVDDISGTSYSAQSTDPFDCGAALHQCYEYSYAVSNPVTATLVANPASIQAGNSSNLTWTASGATTCTLMGPGNTSPLNGIDNVNSGGNASPNGGSVVVTPGSTTTYTLTCMGSGGNGASSNATVTVTTATPVATLTAWPQTLSSPGGSLLQAQCANSTTGNIVGIGSFPPPSVATGIYVATTTTYTLTCTGAGGTATSTVQIVVGGAQPDLVAVNGLPITVSTNQYFSATANITNQGSGPTSSIFPNTLYVSGVDCATNHFITCYSNPLAYGNNLNPLESEQVVSDPLVFTTAGTYYFKWCANTGGTGHPPIPEPNTANNCDNNWVPIVVSPSPLPDLSAGNVTPSTGAIGAPVTFTGSVTNIGSSVANNFPNIIEIMDSTGVTDIANVKTGTISSLGVGATVPITAQYTFSNGGTYQVRTCVNENVPGTNVITEGSPTYYANCGNPTTVTVASPIINSCTASNTSPNVGSEVTYTAIPGAGVTTPYTWSASAPSMCASSSGTSETCTYTTPGSYTMQVAGGNTPSYTCALVTANYPGCTSTAQPSILANGHAGSTVIKNGDAVNITWSGANAGSCTVTGPSVSGATTCSSPTGSSSQVLTGRGVYNINCQTGSASVIVNIEPTEYNN